MSTFTIDQARQLTYSPAAYLRQMWRKPYTEPSDNSRLAILNGKPLLITHCGTHFSIELCYRGEWLYPLEATSTDVIDRWPELAGESDTIEAMLDWREEPEGRQWNGVIPFNGGVAP